MLRSAAAFLALLAACRSAPPPPPPTDLVDGGQLVAQCVHGYDPARHDDTCKVYHRLFAPDGTQISKDLGGLYPHHRGLFLGFNQLRAGGETWDFWHCRRGETQRLVTLAPRADARAQQLAIDWIDGHGNLLLRETRQLTVRGSLLQHQLDCRITLTAAGGPVVLDGDPQHSGLQFRALQAFAPDGAPKLRFLRPEGAHGGSDDIWTGCDWVAAVLPLPQGDVTVLHCDARPHNPRPNQCSTRAYGRFGSTFRSELQPGQPLQLCYRLVVSLGARTAAECEAMAAAFAQEAGR